MFKILCQRMVTLAFDYVVTHLREEEPPRGFKLETALEQIIPGEFPERPSD